MNRFLKHFSATIMAVSISIFAFAQNSTITGTVKSATTKETLSAVTVTVKGTNQGTFTSDKGNFKLNVRATGSYTLVFSSVGFENKEVVTDGKSAVEVALTPAYGLGSEVVVSASRVSERILESPVSVERIGANAIKTAPATNYYDMLANLKGVDVVAASLTFKSISTRGFSGSGNTRLNQLIDGMDNQAPGLNFSVGSVIGLTELDVDNIELLPGASSALYGAGGMNGTVLINSKNPFKYQGLSFQVKEGVNHVDNYQRPKAGFHDYTVRWANKISDRLAYKVSYQYTEAQDWLANNTANYSRTTGTQNGQVIPGYRGNDENYDGVNVYGDETTSSLSSVATSVKSGVAALLGSATYSALYGAAALFPKLSDYNAFLLSKGGASLAAYGPILYGDYKGYFTGMNVSRTGYDEAQIIDPTTKNMKISGALHYKINDKIEAMGSIITGSGNTVYTGSDRYALKNLTMTQMKLEIKSKNWYIRGYKTLENSGDAFNATITTRLFNEIWSPSTTWYPTYASAYSTFRNAGVDATTAARQARGVADANRPTGNIGSTAMFQSLATTPISKGGGKFLDKSVLNSIEGQINLTDALDLAKHDMEWLIGGSVRSYVLNSQGTLFADTANKIWINEFSAYSQMSKKLLDGKIKLAGSLRYDKNDNFAARVTPRFTTVFKIAEDNNIRVSYQEAYRFPTTQNQYINLLVGGGTRLMGGLPQLRNFYNFGTNPAYTLASVTAFGASALAGAPNPSLLQQQQFGDFKPETMRSFEVGYKTLINKKLMIDFYAYSGHYENFIGGVTVLQSRNMANPQVADLLDASKRMAYSISTNLSSNVNTTGWGLSADYLLPRNFSLSASVYSDEIGNLPQGFISYFNTPLFRANFGFSNSGFLFKDRLGFNANLHYQDDFTYEGTFAVGKVDAFSTIDAVATFKLPKYKSMIKAGGTNILNHYYHTAFGSPAIGGLYYVSFAYNIL